MQEVWFEDLCRLMDNIRFFTCKGEEEALVYSFDSNNPIVPHLGADVIINGQIYYVTDVVIAYENGKQYVDIIVEEVD